MFSILFYIVFLAFTLVFFVVMCVAFVLTVPLDRNRIVLHKLSKLWSMCYFGMVPTSKLVIEGKENVAKGETYVVVVNHRSMIDIVLMYVLPLRNFKWVSKREVYKWPLFGWVLWMHGDITIERGSAGSVKKMMTEGCKWLGRGVSVIVFPEGSRSKDDQMNRFREGGFSLAKQAGVPVLPVVTLGTGSVLKKGWRLNFRNVYRVRILPPVPAQEVAQSDPKELTVKVREMMMEEHEQLRYRQAEAEKQRKNKKNKTRR